MPVIARPCTTVASSGVAMIAAPGRAVFDNPTSSAAMAPTVNPVIVNTGWHRTVGCMAAYFIVNSHITDPDGLARYRAAVDPSFEGRDVKILVSTDDATTIEGTPAGERAVVLEFPDREAALAWYNSAEYRDVIGMRLAATEGFAILVDGR